ncbi:hypothetical protein ES703_108020 [subsurface metagenome]
MNDLPKITIITPSYNQGKYLRETIESVLNQHYPKLEYFIVDGGSTDESVEIIRKYEKHIDWWVSEKDEGQSDAIHKGFQRATGDMLGWLNSDDVYFPRVLKKIGEAFARFPEAAIYVGGNAIGEVEDGRIRKCSIPSRPLKICSRYGFIGFGQQSSFFNAKDYRQIGGINRKLYMRMDGDLIYRLLLHNPRVVVIEDMIGFFRWHKKSKSMVSVDRFYEESNDFVTSFDIPRKARNIYRMLYKIYRFCSGGYFKSWANTRRYKGMRMIDIWSKSNNSEVIM